MKTGKFTILKDIWYDQDRWNENEPIVVDWNGILLTLTQHNEKDEVQFLQLTGGQMDQLRNMFNDNDG